ncbi:ribosylnicotinamide kinase [Coccidioides immitis]|nr:ribosylnicotinamide kinase [Coccidioides immitis]
MELQCQKTLLVGLSGPSSSGKTTLARLLRTVFTPPSTEGNGDVTATTRPFVLHQDDFYKPDDQIPVVTTSSGKLVQDWDTIDALDISQFEATLAYIRDHGHLPAGIKSKEDLNDATDSGVSGETVRLFREQVAQRLRDLALEEQRKRSTAGSDRKYARDTSSFISLALIDGFLLYAPPHDRTHPLRKIHDTIDIPFFLPATYTLVKKRRESRTGYVTIGPAPTPKPSSQRQADKQQLEQEEKRDVNTYTPLETNFWTDPPGYVDDIVWPRYIRDHAWLLLPESTQLGEDVEDLKRLVGEGKNLRDDMGVLVAPGNGECLMEELLRWAVGEVLKGVENMFR